MDLVSIIIPVHKTTPYLRECINSAINQTYVNIEVLVICNGALEIFDCKDFLNLAHPKLFFFKSDAGRHHARNKGLEIAKGDYLQFLDFDDLLISDKIEKQINRIQKYNLAKVISITSWEVFNSDTKINKLQDLNYLFQEEKITGLKLYQLLGENKGYIMTASWLFSKELISKSIMWEDVPNDDALFVSEIIKENTVIIAIPEVLTRYRNHSGNTRSLRTKQELVKLRYSWKKISKNLNFKDILVHRYFYNAYFYMLKYAINIKGFNFIPLFSSFMLLSFKAKISSKQVINDSMLLFNKVFGLVKKALNETTLYI